MSSRNNTRSLFDDKRRVAIKIHCLRFQSGYLLFCKAMKLKRRYPDRYNDCVDMLEFFYIGITGKNFSDTGLRDFILFKVMY